MQRTNLTAVHKGSQWDQVRCDCLHIVPLIHFSSFPASSQIKSPPSQNSSCFCLPFQLVLGEPMRQHCLLSFSVAGTGLGHSPL